MMRKIVTMITICLVVGIAAFGVSKRSTYTNITADYKENCNVNLTSENIVINAVEKMRKTLSESPIILRVKAYSELDIQFMRNQQYVQVEEVYKGEGIQVGEIIGITSLVWQFYLNNMYHWGADILYTEGINVMNEGEEYLIFLAKKIDTRNPALKEPIYCLVVSDITPIFSYEEYDNVIVKADNKHAGVPYKAVAQNEFFVETEYAIELLNELKWELIERYPR